MVKIFCDHCGQELRGTTDIYNITLPINKEKSMKEYVLCSICAERVCRFVTKYGFYGIFNPYQISENGE